MSTTQGFIALMGSGEMTSTMVEVHKSLLAAVPKPEKAVFLDTPAGFQLNVDELSHRAEEYFQKRVLHPMTTASFKAMDSTGPQEKEKAFQKLRDSNFILIGPGSPTYAVRQWKVTPIPEIIAARVEAGGCLVAASAAALTIGLNTLPVYEIYKVGLDPYWEPGLDLLARFGMNLVVVPHWNNAEGGTHDTRFCYMGEPRFRHLAALLPEDTGILGLDEHTACILHLGKNQAEVKGIGSITFRHRDREMVFSKGDRFSIDLLRGKMIPPGNAKALPKKNGGLPVKAPISSSEEVSFWDRIHAVEASFSSGLEKGSADQAVWALLALDGLIWQAHRDQESPDFISQAREILRELIVYLGNRLELSFTSADVEFAPMIDALVKLREEFRSKKQFREADAVRLALEKGNIRIEDTEDGTQWHSNE